MAQSDSFQNERHGVRRLAMQLLYQIGHGADPDRKALCEAIADMTPDVEDGLLEDPPETQKEAVGLALDAWNRHEEADEKISLLSPDWPTHRQPAVDRAILRLAYYEIIAERVPKGVAINEAIELAKEFAAENSPAFVNGVLDKLGKSLRHDANHGESEADGPSLITNLGAPSAVDELIQPTGAHADAWLNDALTRPPEPPVAPSADPPTTPA